MNIPLKPKTMPIKHRPYKLNPIYKENVNAQIDNILEASVIKHVEESKWINHMVVQENNQGGIRNCVDLRELNDPFLHDHFPTPFTNIVFENVGGQEDYYFIDGFSRYHQIRITPEGRHKTTFSTEWG
jgi:hypothetical protein